MSGFGPSDTDILFINTLLRASYGIPPIFGGFCCTFYLVVRVRKRKMLRWGLYWMLGGVLGLSFLFMVSPGFTEAVSRSESTIHFKNNTCLSYITAPDTDSWDCLTCLQASTGCGFCRGTHYNILGHSNGACLIAESNGTSKVCIDENRFWSTKHCEPNVFSRLVFLSFVIYTFSYSGSLEIVPWIINSQFYPIEVRGVYGGMAAATNWFFFLVIILLSFFFNSTLGPVFTFLLISLLSFCVLLLIKSFVPENTGFFTSARKRKRD
ncbi:hypothetical protein MKW94_025534 [Papaver nudicaule]|uniref:Uncharacterized protein n=1 Tax=Papaver nudicaule TaxID=74823 RepID=A0AA41VY33_PAPNU|nr:hypothetical protein [Papaver nudicaule]